MTIPALVEFIRDLYQTRDAIPLHAPCFTGNEKAYLLNTLTSTFVSSVGKYVDDFENHLRHFTGCTCAVATVNGTAALSTALYLAGVKPGDLVLTQALTFVATCNAIHHLGAEPVFIDISPRGLGLCPVAMDNWLSANAERTASACRHKKSGRIIRAALPMHTLATRLRLMILSPYARNGASPLLKTRQKAWDRFTRAGTPERLANMAH